MRFAFRVAVAALFTLGSLAGQNFMESEPQLVSGSAGIAFEGPSWDSGTGWVYFVGRSRVSRVDAQGRIETVLQPSRGANGSVVDPQGRVLVCEADGRRVVRIEKDRSVTVLTDNFEGKKYNAPNDLALDSRGRVYFTDPQYDSRDDMQIRDAAGNPIEGVYRVDAPGKVTRVLGREVDRPNGVLVSPGDRYLYIADNNNNTEGGARKLLRFDLRKDGTVDAKSRKILFDWHTSRGPDGFKLDAQGNFWVAAGRNKPAPTETTEEFKSGVYVLSPAGKLLQFIPLPNDETTNLTFAGPDLKTLYVTSGGGLYKARVKVRGMPASR